MFYESVIAKGPYIILSVWEKLRNILFMYFSSVDNLIVVNKNNASILAATH